MVCMQTGSTHTQVCSNYGAEAFIQQWNHFTAVRGHPRIVWSDRGSQLCSAANYIDWSKKEDPARWAWKKVQAATANNHTQWKFVQAGCHWKNGLVESRVKLAKQTLAHLLKDTSLDYTEL